MSFCHDCLRILREHRFFSKQAWRKFLLANPEALSFTAEEPKLDSFSDERLKLTSEILSKSLLMRCLYCLQQVLK